ncbi:MAG: hypothetical protein M1840_002150 [Geoglossum simile]|nr:MAG: hypothetical protein M1840_002150 [Geoglossum simile]
MQAKLSSPTAWRNDTDDEFKLIEFKEIPPEDITVAIFCALSYESVAVKYSLDEEFECYPKTIGPRKYVYSFGRIGYHKVVIARPHQMGTVKAAQCAATVSQQFPNVRFALMLGIGAGIPSLPKCDIRLGDIAVSIPRNNHPGILEYDFGKYEPYGTFVLKGSLNKPPPILISADGSLEEDEMMSRSPLGRILRDITKQPRYARPDSRDILFDQNFHHINKEDDCSGCEASSEKKVVPHIERDKKPGQPVVHRGLILSGGGVVKNPQDRDRLCRGHDDAICFEMEAAGIMDEIPCLVVRGICDYADTHKQDRWHHYAAAVAAAYGKAILLKVYSQDVKEARSMKETMEKLEQKISQMSNEVHNLKQEANDDKKYELCSEEDGLDFYTQAELITLSRCFLAIPESKEQKEILDWLTPIDYGPQQSDYIRRRQAETGQWFLDSEKFQTWLETSKQTLFCPGIPGAGKTIITANVINDLNIRFSGKQTIGIAYIYCNFRQQHEQKAYDLLSSLLKQLSQERPVLPDAVKDLYDRHRAKRTRPLFDELSRALHVVTAMHSRIFIIVDALDECQISDGSLTRFLTELFNLQAKCGANLFATSRPTPEITGKFERSITLEIRANKDDVERYLDGHMFKLPGFVAHDCKLQEKIKSEISKAVDGMFLLAPLHLDSLIGKRSPRAIQNALKELPTGSRGYDYAYKDAMKRIEGQLEDQVELAKQVLSWIVCARRPLTTLELQHGLAIQPSDSELDEQNLSDIVDMVSACAGLVTVDEDSGIIRLVHYTTQKYFERTQKEWFPHAEDDITTTCVTYLSFRTFENGFCTTDKEFEERLQSNRLYSYAAQNWGHHAHAASIVMEQLIQNLLENKTNITAASQAMMASGSYSGYSQRVPRQMTGVHVAAYFGLVGTIMGLLNNGHNPGLQDSYGRTPLSWAAQSGHEAVVKLLLATEKVDVDSKDSNYGQTPLSWAAGSAHEAVVKLLLATEKVDVDSKDSNYGRTPLSWAAGNGHEAVVKLLLATEKVDVDSKDSNYGRTPLSWAAWSGHEAVVKLLLATEKVDVDSKDSNYGQTPLSWAAWSGHEAVVKLLLATEKVDVDSKDSNYGRTPLSWAAGNGHEAVVKLLLATEKVDVDSKDSNYGQTPLSWAARSGHEAVVKLLLATEKVDVDSKDSDYGQTPLSWAAWSGHQAVVKLLLATEKVDVDSKDSDYGQTPLSWAARSGHQAVVKLLLATEKVDVDSKDSDYGRTPLSWAAQSGHQAVVKLLLATEKVDVDSKDSDYGRTPLSWAAQRGLEAVVKLLLATEKVDVDSKDDYGRTPLSWAAENGREAVVKDSDYGRTPLSWAAQSGHQAVVKLLLATEKVDVDSKDSDYGRTPLSWAAQSGLEAVVKLLLATEKVDVDSKDDYGRTPLSWAAENGREAVVKLLQSYYLTPSPPTTC